MAYNEKLAQKVREALCGIRYVHEKKMFGGIAFMVNDKMCVGVDKDDLMLRCEPEQTDELLTKKGVRIFNLTGKPMKGWLLIGPEGTSEKRNLDYWISLAMKSNTRIKPSKKLKTK
jgi:TfoX/Sxy family transcriptional regulator of competence genes